jgi:hypothetical protein
MHTSFKVGASITLAVALSLGSALAATAEEVPVETTQEVASSPDTQTTSEVMSLTSPTPAVEDTAEPTATPTGEKVTPPAGSPVDSSQPTEPTTTVSPESPASGSGETSSLSSSTPSVATASVPTATKTLRWILPNGGTAKNVTWPQPVYNKANVALLPCSTVFTVQVDSGPYGTKAEKALADSFDDDGILTNGEDHGWVTSWDFETYTSPTCPKVPVTPGQIVVNPPTCDLPGSLAVDLSAPTGADNGFNQYALGLRYFFDNVPNGAGTYNVTIQGVGAGAVGYEATFPYGTKVTQTVQTVTVLPATGVTQSTDSSASCYVAPETPEEPEVPTVPTTPTTPEVPTTPELPTTPATPATPSIPVTLVDLPAAPAAPAVPVAATERLASTGADTYGPLAVAFFLLFIGGATVLVKRIANRRQKV